MRKKATMTTIIYTITWPPSPSICQSPCQLSPPAFYSFTRPVVFPCARVKRKNALRRCLAVEHRQMWKWKRKDRRWRFNGKHSSSPPPTPSYIRVSIKPMPMAVVDGWIDGWMACHRMDDGRANGLRDFPCAICSTGTKHTPHTHARNHKVGTNGKSSKLSDRVGGWMAFISVWIRWRWMGRKGGGEQRTGWIVGPTQHGIAWEDLFSSTFKWVCRSVQSICWVSIRFVLHAFLRFLFISFAL